MTEKRIDSRIIHKHDSQINWAANDSFIPKQGEIIIYDSDVDLPYSCMKVGDGQTSVEGLPFILPEPVINEALDSKADKSDLDNYLTKKDYIAGESGGLIDLSNFLTRNEADNLYASANIIELVYPVGSFYLSINDVNPQILFGFGSWQRIEGKFLFGADTAHALGTTGGEETHTLPSLSLKASPTKLPIETVAAEMSIFDA